MSRLYVLQSGFVTTNDSQLVRSTKKEASLKEKLLSVSDHRIVDTDNFYDEDIERLFMLWHKDNSLIRRFEFREAILNAAVRLFGHESRNNSIVPWVRLQMTQRTVGYLHRRFIKEMLLSSYDSKEKTMDNFNYFRLLSARFPSDDQQTKVDDVQSFLEESIKTLSSTELVSVLFSWTRDIRGFGDLLHTLHVIAGRRDASSHSPGTPGAY